MGKDNFLSSAEEWLFKEVELLYQLHTEIRSTHLKYQSWFMVAHGVLLAATINLRLNVNFTSYTDFYYLVCSIGLTLGICFWLLQLRHISDGDGRMKRIRAICGRLKKAIDNETEEPFEFMAYVGGDIDLRKLKIISYSRIRLIVDSIFPLLWLALIIIQILR